jgi:hypothetical protein
MNKFGLKKWLIVLVAFFGFASMGSAQKIDVGFHFGNNPSFTGLGGNFGIEFSKTIGLRIDLDFSLVKASAGVPGTANFGFDANLIFKLPLSSDGSDLYLGPGIFFAVGENYTDFGIGALLGIEIQLAPKVGFFVETSPLFVSITGQSFFLSRSFFRTGLNFYL